MIPGSVKCFGLGSCQARKLAGIGWWAKMMWSSWPLLAQGGNVMPLLIKGPACKKFLSADHRKCEVIKQTKAGPVVTGCGKKIPVEKRVYFAYWRDPQGNVQRKKIGPSKAAAENFLREVETSLVEGRYIDRRIENKVTVSEYAEKKYWPFCEVNQRGWGIRSKRIHLDRIKARFGSKRLQDVTTDDLTSWRKEYTDKPIMWNRIFQTLRAMYRYCLEADKKMLTDIPFSTKNMLFDEEKERVRWLTDNEERALLDACSDHLRPIVLTALYTGLRKSDLLALRLGTDIDTDSRVIRRKQGKTGSAVDIRMTDELFEALQPLTQGKKPGELVFEYQGKQIGDVKTAFNTAVKKSGIVNPNILRVQDFTFHDLRHCFACKLVKNGVDLFTVSKLLGHKSTKMVEKYAHLQPESVDRATNVMNRISMKIPEKGKVLPFAATG
jgi:integrase